MRRPDVSRRTQLLGAAAIVLAVVCAVVLAVPATRGGVLDAWCRTTGTGCPGSPGPGAPRPGEPDWRLRLDPEAAATWGHYAALGDSYSSGDGADDYVAETAVTGGCWRSANAYPETVAAAYDFAGRLGFYACSSQRGHAMLDELGSTDSQIDRVTAHTSLVTIGIGGNDLGFTSVLRTCMVRLPLVDTTACKDQESDIERRMRLFEATFADLVDEIRERAPDARMLVVGYPRLFPSDPDGMYYTLNANDQEWLNDTLERFNGQVAEAVAEADTEIGDEGQVGSVEYVDVFTALNGHEVGTDEAWLNGVLLRDLTSGISIDRSTFHPTSAGQDALAERVRAQIDAGPGRPLYATRSTVDNASPDVLAAEAD
ncbi:SGNH/GDSL hydrolase family protein [Nocardiopsis sediminis]|uniref:SGNH/GDSL hydrolase family protein n=1 Tax=Nocardiopsis sediminis TaxID=1778267 RepID=A0ABV8FGT5_9ACTN